jgi:hypothetical protein
MSAESIKQKVSETLEAGLEAVNQEEFPTSVEDKEKFFMAQISAGETLCAQGNVFFLAIHVGAKIWQKANVIHISGIVQERNITLKPPCASSVLKRFILHLLNLL